MRKKWGRDVAGLSSVGYAEVCHLLDGKLAASGLSDAIFRSTRRYARRQLTWFAKEPGARRFASAEELSRAIDTLCPP